MRLPDAARVAFYHKNFFGTPMGAWTQAAMRGPSKWGVGAPIGVPKKFLW